MKTIGLLGGMSWESTVSYYQGLNQGVKQCLGGLHSAKVILHSVDFEAIARLQHEDDWDGLAQLLSQAAQGLERAGADGVMICTNTMHKVAPQVIEQVGIPLLHIVDATGQALQQQGIKRIGLLGTCFTMEDTFFSDHLKREFDIEVITPAAGQRTVVHDVIYQELCQGECKQTSREAYLHIMQQLVDQGAEGIILGCTEIGLLVKPEHTNIPLFDTTQLHVGMALDWMLASQSH